jgi:hypothetical protein
MASLIGLSGVWFHYRVRLGQLDEAGDEDEDEDPAATDPKLLTDLHNEEALNPSGSQREGVAERVNPATSFSELGAEDIAAFTAKEKERAAAAKAEAEAKARIAAEAAAWEAAEADGGAPTPVQSWGEAAPGANRTIQGFPSAPPAKDEDAADPDEIAAMLAAVQGGGDDAGDGEKAGNDDIAAMLAAANGDETAGSASQSESESEGAGADDIAAMLAQSRDDAQAGDDEGTPSNPAAAEDIAALLKAERDRQTEAGESSEMAPAEDNSAPSVASDEPVADVEIASDDVAPSPGDTLTELTAPSPDEVTSSDVVPEESGADIGSDDIAAMLAQSRDDKA